MPDDRIADKPLSLGKLSIYSQQPYDRARFDHDVLHPEEKRGTAPECPRLSRQH